MVIRSGLFNSVRDVNGIGDRRYDALWFAEYFATFIGNGVFPNPSNGLQVVEGENMTTVVKAGKAWINGYFVTNDSDHILDHDNADGVLQRVDRIVARLNFVEREIEIVVKKGSFASNPVAPNLQRDGDAYELALADVLITNGATQITQAHITDTQLNTALCGIVHGLVDQVDTTTIFNQYQSWFNNVTSGTEQEIEDWQQAQYQQFVDWFATIQVILDGDVAANLASRIASLEQQFGDIEDLQTSDKTSLVAAINEVKQIGNNVKVDTVDALLSVDDSLPINPSSPWADIITQISNISTGKKWASGATNGFGATTSLVVNGLTFKPSVVIFKAVETNGGRVIGFFNDIFLAFQPSDTTYEFAGSLSNLNSNMNSNSSYLFSAKRQPNNKLWQGGFSLMLNLLYGPLEWIAYE